MAFVASGRIHGAVFRSDKAWDYEPRSFICKMAGASIKSINGFHVKKVFSTNDAFCSLSSEWHIIYSNY